jgi:Rrf2 family transcriptional regulator, iron-sulfur cluster assembly transcription factor
VPVLSRRGILAIAAVVDIALQKDGRPVTAKALAARHGLSSRYLELLLQRLVRDDILKGFRGQRGGYRLVSEQSGVTANDILRTATKHATEEETNSDLVTKVVIPICPRPNMNLDKRQPHYTGRDRQVRKAQRLRRRAPGKSASDDAAKFTTKSRAAGPKQQAMIAKGPFPKPRELLSERWMGSFVACAFLSTR